MNRVAAVVLAAGRSRRMGRTKQLIPYRHATVIECVLEQAIASTADDVVVVLGHDAARIRSRVERFDVHVVINPLERDDMVGSVICALDWMSSLAPRPAGFLLCLADQPDIPTSAHNAVLAEFRRRPSGIVVATHTGRRGHPSVFAAAYEAEIRSLGPDVGLNALQHRHVEDVREVAVDDDAVLRDLDRPEDLPAGP